MSEIDTIKHRWIGLFHGVSVYEPLECGKIGYRNPQDGHLLPEKDGDFHFHNVRVGCLLIGGGSGEHPAIVFHDIEHAVARYILHAAPSDQLPPDIVTKAAAIQPDYQTIEYCNWSNEDHVGFRAVCAHSFVPYADAMTFEAWLLLNVGEFVFQVLPSFTNRISNWRNQVTFPCFQALHGITIPGWNAADEGQCRFRIVDQYPNGG